MPWILKGSKEVFFLVNSQPNASSHGNITMQQACWTIQGFVLIKNCTFNCLHDEFRGVIQSQQYPLHIKNSAIDLFNTVTRNLTFNFLTQDALNLSARRERVAETDR